MTKDEQIEILKQGLYHIKDHMSIVVKGDTSISEVWRIADNTLSSAELDTQTDNDRKFNDS